MAALELSFIAVTFHSAARAAGLCGSLRRELAASGLTAEVILVDHSESEREARALAELAPDRLLTRPNRGYAAGLNAGLAVARGETVILANPDLELLPGALAALLAALDGGAALVGPQFELAGFLFPPAEVQRPKAELGRLLAESSPRALRRALARGCARWSRVWRAEEPLTVEALSGALLALRRSTAAALGPWDEGYFLYFEEMEWQRRALRRGLSLCLAPAARVRHAWGHAAEPGASGPHFERSRARFYAQSFPVTGRLVLSLPRRRAPWAWPPLPDTETLTRMEGGTWLVSPSPSGSPAAGAPDLRPAELQQAICAFARARSHEGPLTVSFWDRRAGELQGPWCWSRSEERG